jgi:hypothetical protein
LLLSQAFHRVSAESEEAIEQFMFALFVASIERCAKKVLVTGSPCEI